MAKSEKLMEYAKCASSPIYTTETYFQTFDQTQNGYVPFLLFQKQKEILKNYAEHRFNLIKKYRQSGITTITAAFAAWLLAFASKTNPEKILIVANKRETAMIVLKKVKDFLEQLPDWIFDKKYDKDSQSYLILPNGSEVKAVATSMDALRGYTPTLLIIDEAAHIDGGDEFWSASLSALSTGGKGTLISTPSGFDAIFYKTYNEAIKEKNDFVITDIKWYEDPRYTKDLRWVKWDDDQSVVEWDLSKMPQLIKLGYKPTSTWFEGMKKQLGSTRMVAQELEGSFLGSGDTVIDEDTIKKQNENNVCEPIRKELSNKMWIWVDPIKEHRYILSADISRGDSDDYSSIVIIDYDTMEEVAEYQGKIPPDEIAEIIYDYGKKYGDALVIIDITGGMGVATSLKLKEKKYKNLYYEYKGKDPFKVDTRDMVPGFQIEGHNRTLIIDSMEQYLRTDDFKVKSQRATNEMNTFVYINGRPNHMKGYHDDILLAIAMGIYVSINNFKKLIKNQEHTKAMLDSWSLSTSDNLMTLTHSHNEPGKMNRSNGEYIPNSVDEYLWVFGINKRTKK